MKYESMIAEMIDNCPEAWCSLGEPQIYISEPETVDIVIEAHRKIKAIWPDYEVHQIKTKFGWLDFYTNEPPENISNEVHKIKDELQVKYQKLSR